MKTLLVQRIGMFALAIMLLSACSTGPEEEAPGEAPVSEPAPLGGTGSDPCLQGNWEMSNEDVNSMMADLAYVPGLSIPTGTLVMSFTGNDFAYGSRDLVMRIDMPDGYMEAEAAFLFTATFTTAEGMLMLSDIIYSAETFVWRAVIDGQVEETAGPNTLLFPAPGNGPYGCSADALTIQTAGGAGGPVVLFFTRQP
jgi:hypothetical protein